MSQTTINKEKVELFGIGYFAGALSSLLNNFNNMDKEQIRTELKDMHTALGLYAHEVMKEVKND
jgi:hypothetical protein